MTDIVKVYRDSKKEWRWTRTHSNTKIVGASTESYKRKAGVLRNIEATQKQPYLLELDGDEPHYIEDANGILTLITEEEEEDD